jgi:hypothetical protein
MEFPARNVGHATQQEQKKQRRKTARLDSFVRFLLQEMMQEKMGRSRDLPQAGDHSNSKLFNPLSYE